MRLVHFSDTHLGHQQFSRTDPETGLNQREQDHYEAFNEIIRYCLETKPDLVIHAGDLFDGVRPSNRALAVALAGFVSLDRAGIPTVVISGNHEHPKMLETGSPFRLFEHLENIHPVYKGRREAIDIGGRIIHAVPQCADNAALQEQMRQILDESSVRPGQDVLVLHGGVMGVEAFHHAEFNELSIDPAWFTGARESQFAYVALGHYHGRSEVATRAHYCGAPDRVSMRESGETKGFLDVTLGTSPTVTFQQTKTRPYSDLPVIHAGGLDAAELEVACKQTLDQAPSGAVARLRIQDISPELRGSLDWKGLRAAGSGLLDLKIEATFGDEAHRAATGTEIGGLGEEFEAYAASYPLDGVDRKELLQRARQLLGGK